MAADAAVGDHRFQGYDNNALATLVDDFRGGSLAQHFSTASQALRDLAKSLDEADVALRQELAGLGTGWKGLAGENAGTAFSVQAQGAGQGSEAAAQNSEATAAQGNSYSDTRNNLPESQTLRGATENGFLDNAAGFFGYETDHAAEVKATQAARETAIRGFEQYQSASQDALGQYQSMNKPPTYDVTAVSSAATAMPSVQQFSGTPGGLAVGGSAPGGLVGAPGAVGGGSVTGFPGLPGGGLVGTPGGGGGGGLSPQLPGGGSTGIAPVLPGLGTPGGGGGSLLGKLPGGSNFGLGLGLGLAGAAGLGVAASTARGGQVVRGGAGGAGGAGALTGDAAKAAGVKNSGPVTGKSAGVSATIGAIDGDERLGRGGAAGRGALAGKAGAASMMQPAASAKGGPDEEDGEHIRKYGVDSDDVFGDERMVVQSVIGDEPEAR
ncbi:hypothetical protein [Actinosynnema mirum]|uniref:PPE family domain-containing protein n=1 Tax=Actinosynnema mirum (strain ATCC 29888 / DSM 43827 / JCM 3225 / NBRC 14064 / NCIMB 13271 / NRRL B-12336 / IMRU 3971 / 101) TaxID=446462 RepID=C6WR02_ACTMD|nr:hypothetical protein [Actinosynnema mirum]ACU40695.1 hypothetical protein Amir_6900 [Actinosynnema mirum DSM 43827]